MSAPINDGGPAFPLSPEVGGAHFDDPYAYHGMTLRDWFAGQALAGMSVSNETDSDPANWRWDNLAYVAYAAADAMLAARGRKVE